MGIKSTQLALWEVMLCETTFSHVGTSVGEALGLVYENQLCGNGFRGDYTM